jgi:hypothetical protein
MRTGIPLAFAYFKKTRVTVYAICSTQEFFVCCETDFALGLIHPKVSFSVFYDCMIAAERVTENSCKPVNLTAITYQIDVVIVLANNQIVLVRRWFMLGQCVGHHDRFLFPPHVLGIVASYPYSLKPISTSCSNANVNDLTL